MSSAGEGRGTSGAVEVVLRSSRVAARQAAGATVLLAVGVGALVGSVLGSEPGAARVAGIVIGVVLVALGVPVGLSVRVELADRRLVLDGVGIRWTVAGEQAWLVAWPELARAGVRVGYRVGRGGRRRPRVSLELVPVHPRTFGAVHPELEHLRGVLFSRDHDRVGIPFAARVDVVEPLREGLARFAGPRDGGVDQAGTA